MRKIVIASLIALAAVQVAAQDPNQARGFQPGRVYDFLGLDAVSAFNGNLNVRIPLGPVYSVRPGFEYQFMLAYNSKVWDFKFVEEAEPEDTRQAVPEKRSNAGLGWRLTFGELLRPQSDELPDPNQGWTYVAPDGSEHVFPNFELDPLVANTDDSSYLQLRRVPQDRSQAVQYRDIYFPDGLIRRFLPTGQLYEIRDRYGNWVRVVKTAYEWTITDGYENGPATRTHKVILSDRPQTYQQPNFRRLPTRIELAAAPQPAGAPQPPAIYELVHGDYELPRGGCGQRPTSAPTSYWVPLLDEIKLPDGSTFSPTYEKSALAETCTTGTMLQLTLPTLGRIAWQHGQYTMPNQRCIEPQPGFPGGWLTTYSGIVSRSLYASDGSIVEKRTYTPELILRDSARQDCGEKTDHLLQKPPEEFRNHVKTSFWENGIEQIVDKTTSYFSAYPMEAPAQLRTHANANEYGLPFCRREEHGGRFVSSTTYACSGGTCDGTVLRTTYLKYPYHAAAEKPFNPRVEAQRTLYNSDNNCGGQTCYTDTEHTDFDGYGHYRRTTHTGNMAGATRTLTTEYAPDPGAWLLNKYTATNVTEGGVVTQRMTYTFDAAGQLQSKRVLAGTTAGMGDLLSVTCRDARGYVTSEKFLGGNGRTPPADSSDLCSATVGDKEYEIAHEYPVGSGFRSWHKARYAGISPSFSIVDEELDSNTGLVTKTRDAAGLETSYQYDLMARLSSIAPPGGAATSLVYRNASSSEPARVTSTTGSTTAVEQTYDYDGLGRLFREKRRMPDGSWALRKTDYRGAGSTKFTSEWVRLAAGGDENLVSPTVGTKFEQDQFGRTTKLTTPDNKVVTTTYTGSGVREVKRTRTLATPTSTAQSVTVTEGYDLHGKLVRVSEPAGRTSAGQPLGGTVETDYEYDSGGKLVKVTMLPPAGSGTPAQIREFSYDARGLLEWERHPEKTLPTTYGSFDARGHAWTSTDADVPMMFEFDKAERLTRVSNAANVTIKQFIFGTSNDCTYCLGKLRKAIRNNTVSGLGNVRVTETYDYGANGLASKRETLLERDGATLKQLSQDFHYDELLALDRVDYPTCVSGGCTTANGLAVVDHTRTRGLLTQIAGFASIGYHPSGMVTEVRRATTPVIDTYTSDSDMARPAEIAFTGTTACTTPATPVVNAPTFACAGSSGQASVANPEAGVTYTWTIQNGTLGSITGTTVSFTAGASGLVTLTVKAENACASVDSAPKPMSIPQATLTGGAVINAGNSAALDVALTGTPPWRLTWSDGSVDQNINATPFRKTVSPSATTTYQLAAATDATSCNLTRTGSATITVRPNAPGWITAHATDRTVEVQWQEVSVAGGARYDLERADNVNATSWDRLATAIAALSYVDTVPADAGGGRRAYVYRVTTVAADGTRSPVEWSPRDYAVTATAMYPSGPITPGATRIQAQHIVELRRAIDALRKLVGLSEVFTAQVAPSGVVRAADFAALLAPMDQARATFGHGTFIYANGIQRPASGGTIKAAHVTQLREVLR